MAVHRMQDVQRMQNPRQKCSKYGSQYPPPGKLLAFSVKAFHFCRLLLFSFFKCLPSLSQEARSNSRPLQPFLDMEFLDLRVSRQPGLGIPRKCSQVLLCLWTETWNTWEVAGSVLGTHFGKTSLTHMNASRQGIPWQSRD